MAENRYSVEVQSDFLEKITKAKPVQALAELIWNGLDADSRNVDVSFTYGALDGGMSAITVSDGGAGILFSNAPELFSRLGGSWKHPGGVTKIEKRFLHGQEGRGRFKAFSLGRVAEWDVTYEKNKELWTYKIMMSASNIREVRISEEVRAPQGRKQGVILSITELHKEHRGLTSEVGFQELSEIFALYLADYNDVTVRIDHRKIDPASVIASRQAFDLKPIVDSEEHYSARLEIIEWRTMTNRALYLCTEQGFPLLPADRRFQIGNFQFSGYLKSSYFSKLLKDGTVELSLMNAAVVGALDESQHAIKAYFRSRAAQEAKTVVDKWKADEIYPFKGEAGTMVEQAERQVFDIVAVSMAQHLQDFANTPSKTKAFNLQLLRQAIEKGPEDLQLIFEQVLNLPKRKQEELAELLRDVSLSAIISAAKIVTDRLKFLTGLEAILFDPEPRQRLKERSQLHRIIAQNCWLFGEEYNLSVDDQSLTEVLRVHKKLLGEDIIIDEPVKHITKTRGIVDLMLSKAIRQHKANSLTHLVIELKAPKVNINDVAVNQIEKYAFSVAKDVRFKNVNTNWVFWVISDDLDDYATQRVMDNNGLLYSKGNISIYAKTWAQVLDENRARLQFFQERLEYQADKGSSLKHLQERYDEFLQGVLTEEPVQENSPEEEKAA
jgi:hypothetical protein